MVLQTKFYRSMHSFVNPRRELVRRSVGALVGIFKDEKPPHTLVCHSRYNPFRYRNRLD